MSVRKRAWTTRKGERRKAWIVDYTDQTGNRTIETFDRKKDADARHDAVRSDMRKGIHITPNKSVTVEEAAENWLTYIEREGRERATLDQYRQHVRLHINPRLGKDKIAALNSPAIEKFRDDLLGELSRPLAKKVLVSLKSIFREAQRRGDVVQNVAASVSIKIDKRSKRRLEAGRDIPTTGEMRAIVNAATGKQRALVFVAAFAGLRASELRGLRWDNVDLEKRELYVRERADRYNQVGKPKSHAGERTIPMGPMLANTLKEWKLACPNTLEGYVFPTSRGRIDHHANILRALEPVMKSAKVMDGDKPKYALHAFRHFYASWCINRVADGGLGLPAKVVQERLGHASIVMTMDVYGHLFPRADDGSELEAAERALLA